MTSSMQLAQECLQQDAANAGNAQPLEAVELFAQTIDSSKIFYVSIFVYNVLQVILKIVKVSFFNTKCFESEN